VLTGLTAKSSKVNPDVRRPAHEVIDDPEAGRSFSSP